MRVLIDSHSLIWALDDPTPLSAVATTTLQDPANDLVVSPATLWESAIKAARGKLPLSFPYRQWMDQAIADLGLIVIPITLDHTERLVTMPFHHRDPFDRLITVQALVEGLPLVSADTIFDAYGVDRIWNYGESLEVEP